MNHFMNQIIFFLVLTTTIIASTDIAYAENKIEIFTLNKQISTTDDILVTGFINAESSYKPVTLKVYDPNGYLLYRPDVYFDDNGQFSWLFHPPLGKFDLTGTYTIIASHEEISETTELKFTVNEKIVERSLTSSIAYNNPTNSKPTDTSESTSDKSENNQQQSKNQLIQKNSSKIISDSPIFITILVLTLIGTIIAIIIWIRKTYEKPLTK